MGTRVASSPEIATFWEAHPCDDALVREKYLDDYQKFFDAYDAYRYDLEGHILRRLDEISWKDKRVLEVGLGQGADAEQIIRRGAIWTGIDLTKAAVDRTRTRLRLRGLPYEDIRQADVANLPKGLGGFEIVYAYGVLHHVPDIRRAQAEIHRVLNPSGELVIMLYARWSLNYVLSISLLRRIALAGALAANKFGWKPSGIVRDHVRNARKHGVLRYLAEPTWTSRNTDGPQNPYSKVYDMKRIQKDFPLFSVHESHREFMHGPPLPLHGLPGGSILGWHLWLRMRPYADRNEA